MSDTYEDLERLAVSLREKKDGAEGLGFEEIARVVSRCRSDEDDEGERRWFAREARILRGRDRYLYLETLDNKAHLRLTEDTTLLRLAVRVMAENMNGLGVAPNMLDPFTALVFQEALHGDAYSGNPSAHRDKDQAIEWLNLIGRKLHDDWYRDVYEPDLARILALHAAKTGS